MTQKSHLRLPATLPKGRFMKLLILLLGLLVLSPLFEEYFKLRLLGDPFFTAIFIYASYSLSRRRRLATSAVSLAVPTMVSI